MTEALYPPLVWFHVLLFVVWLGGEIGVLLLGRHFCRRHTCSLETRLVLMKLLVALDMGPRSAAALMVPSSLLLLTLGGWWPYPPDWLLVAGLVLGALWLALLWRAHLNDRTQEAARARAVEGVLRWLLAGFYLALGAVSLINGGQPIPPFLGWKALLFGLTIVAALLVDSAFRPVGPRLATLLLEGSSDATEVPLRAAMDRTRMFVLVVHALLLVASYIGVAKPGSQARDPSAVAGCGGIDCRHGESL